MKNKLGITFRERDVRGLRRAIDRNPNRVKIEASKAFARINAQLLSSIIRNPWRIGGTGGGSPVDTTNLREAHRKRIKPYEARIWVNQKKAPYGVHVHEGTYKMEARPWLDHAIKSRKNKIDLIARKFLEAVVRDLGK
jgi:hypothetical protein